MTSVFLEGSFSPICPCILSTIVRRGMSEAGWSQFQGLLYRHRLQLGQNLGLCF